MLSFLSALITWAGAGCRCSGQLAKAIPVCSRPQVHTKSIACPQESPWPTLTPTIAPGPAWLTPRFHSSLTELQLLAGLPRWLGTACPRDSLQLTPTLPVAFVSIWLVPGNSHRPQKHFSYSSRFWYTLPPGLPMAQAISNYSSSQSAKVAPVRLAPRSPCIPCPLCR